MAGRTLLTWSAAQHMRALLPFKGSRRADLGLVRHTLLVLAAAVARAVASGECKLRGITTSTYTHRRRRCQLCTPKTRAGVYAESVTPNLANSDRT
jgi:hypothetical protein